MKTRLDYVSNSSSSSFMLVGCAFEDSDIKKGWIALHPEDASKVDGDNDGEDFDYDLAYGIANELGLECERGICNYYDNWVIGLPFDKMDDNETKKQFIERVSSALKKAFSNASVNAIVDGGYEG